MSYRDDFRTIDERVDSMLCDVGRHADSVIKASPNKYIERSQWMDAKATFGELTDLEEALLYAAWVDYIRSQGRDILAIPLCEGLKP